MAVAQQQNHKKLYKRLCSLETASKASPKRLKPKTFQTHLTIHSFNFPHPGVSISRVSFNAKIPEGRQSKTQRGDWHKGLHPPDGLENRSYFHKQTEAKTTLETGNIHFENRTSFKGLLEKPLVHPNLRRKHASTTKQNKQTSNTRKTPKEIPAFQDQVDAKGLRCKTKISVVGFWTR